MKYIIIFFLCVVGGFSVSQANMLTNGDFEIQTTYNPDCALNYYQLQFNTRLSNVHQFNGSDFIDIFKSASELPVNCGSSLTNAHHGSYYLNVESHSNGSAAEGFSMQFNGTANVQYELTFAYKVYSVPGPLLVTISMDPDMPGTVSTLTVNPVAGPWTQASLFFTPQSTGSYYVTVSTQIAASPYAISVDNFNLNTATDVVEFDPNIPVNIFPNPTTESAQLAGLGETQKKIVVTDLNGKRVLVLHESTEAVIDLSEHGSGIYFVRITDEKTRQTRTLQLTKIHQ